MNTAKPEPILRGHNALLHDLRDDDVLFTPAEAPRPDIAGPAVFQKCDTHFVIHPPFDTSGRTYLPVERSRHVRFALWPFDALRCLRAAWGAKRHWFIERLRRTTHPWPTRREEFEPIRERERL